MEAQEGEALLRACTEALGLESQVTQLHKKTACVKTTVVILADLRHVRLHSQGKAQAKESWLSEF